MNDILPCVDDVLELIWQSRHNNAGITCAADYIFLDKVVRTVVVFVTFSNVRTRPCFTIIGYRAI